MADIHFFNTDVAAEYGINAAVILQNLWYWIKHNEANDENYYDGYYWTFNSSKAFEKLFPYLSKKQIETALKKLRDDGIIVIGNYNRMKYDRTLWYAITTKGQTLLQKGEMHFPSGGNGNYLEGKWKLPGGEMDITSGGNGNYREVTPIPYINTDITSNVNTDSKHNNVGQPDYRAVIEYLNEATGSNYKVTTKATREKIKARFNEGFTVEDFKTVIDKKCSQWLNDKRYQKYLRPETLFGTKFESYLNEQTSAMDSKYQPILNFLKED